MTERVIAERPRFAAARKPAGSRNRSKRKRASRPSAERSAEARVSTVPPFRALQAHAARPLLEDTMDKKQGGSITGARGGVDRRSILTAGAGFTGAPPGGPGASRGPAGGHLPPPL